MKTLIIGGGLSGLALAETLQSLNQNYVLVEARSRFGGRIKTEHLNSGYFDMGPAWFWPGQPRMAALIDRLGLEQFDQFASGDLMYENERGQVQRGRGFSSMQGSWRLKGGLAALTAALADRIPDARKRPNSVVTALERTETGITATCQNGEVVKADRVVLALPPRVAAQIRFTPPLPQPAVQTMQGIATWMAGQAKAIAVYDTPFWRNAGLSGDAQSRIGPMVEIHDASPATGGPYALFGFIGIPPGAREDQEVLRDQVQAQLTRLFGPDAATPRQIYIKDWASDPHTSIKADKAPLYAHPTYGLPQALSTLWDGQLVLSGTEVASEFGGYLEGALEAAETALQVLMAEER